MSINLHVYASTDPIYFKFTLAGVGVDPTLVLGDVTLSKDGGTVTDIPLVELTPVDALNMVGAYLWTPTAVEASCKVMVVNIKDQAGSAFDENMLIISTGGHASARFSG